MWVHRLEHDYTWNCGRSFFMDEEVREFRDDKGRLWLEIRKNGDITVKKDYAWDGCTPKINILDLFVIGTPDGIIDIKTGKPKTYYASLIHDALYQFMYDDLMPFDRKDMDEMLLKIMQRDNFMLAPIYYMIVRVIAGLWRKIMGHNYDI